MNKLEKTNNSSNDLRNFNQSLLKKDDFFQKVADIIEQARSHISHAVDTAMSVTYYYVGQLIVEQEQGGKARAEYGKNLLAELSEFLTARLGRGYSETNLRNFRKFYLTYSKQIQQNVSAELPANNKIQIRQNDSVELNLKLGWSHYQLLMRIENETERRFYEIEAIKENWGIKELKRQYGSSLYERLALSKDKNKVAELAKQGQIIEKPRDIIKNPLVLEFLGLEDKSAYSENDLETAIIDKLQHFLLELGKGFLFEARQKRFSFNEKHFFVDLVFYNRLLQCYVLIDLKIDELKHQDIGQMQMYVNYFDRYVKRDFEKPTIGLLLCKKKDDSIVELTLSPEANIYASEYNLYLPDKTLLQQKLTEWAQN
jgi:predicted nuclease of restriction endonuclease-like (RecB) superfamily